MNVLHIEAISIAEDVRAANINAGMEKNMDDLTTIEGDAFTCRGCRERVGALVDWHGKVYLQVGKQRVYSFHGICDCGQQIHFDSSEIILRRLVERKKSRRSF